MGFLKKKSNILSYKIQKKKSFLRNLILNKSFCNQTPNYQCAHAIQSRMRFKCSYTESKMAVAHQYTHTRSVTPNRTAITRIKTWPSGKKEQYKMARISSALSPMNQFPVIGQQQESSISTSISVSWLETWFREGRTLRENLTQLILFFLSQF